MTDKDNALATANNEIGTLMAGGVGNSYCSIAVDPKDRKTASRVYNALNNPEHRVADFINKDIHVSDILIEVSEVVSEETGEYAEVPRVVLIDDEGKAYQAVSIGMFNAIKNAVKVFGTPTWEPPLTMTIKQKNVKNGSMLTAEVKA